MANKESKLERLKLIRQKQILQARKSFWQYNKTISPDFYKDDREYLFILSNTLQALYEERIIKQPPEIAWKVVDSVEGLENYIVCKKLMMNLPPQHGKSRTLVNFADWVFGKNPKEKIITCSYNDSTASDFSRYTRDGISTTKIEELDIVYSDIFPNTKIKQGNASFEKWALEGQHFSYLGAGIGGSITGKGGTILLVDDAVKDAEVAFNESALDKIWLWYTGTFLSRVSAENGEPIEIVNMTRWAAKDICGRILDGAEAHEWYVLKMEAYDTVNHKMLCEQVLSKKRYNSLKVNMDSSIFEANYHQKPVDIKGVLYKKLKTYTILPPYFEQIISYTDTADEGSDYLCSIVAGLYQGEAYILDVYYTQDGMEVTEPKTAEFFVNNKVNLSVIESNNGGKGFARNVSKAIWQMFKTKSVVVKWFHQSLNKMGRILTNSTFVISHVYFPERWRDKWPDFYRAITSYQKGGKNKNDDAPDALTGIAEICQKKKIKLHDTENKTEDQQKKPKRRKRRGLY